MAKKKKIMQGTIGAKKLLVTTREEKNACSTTQVI